MTRRLFAILSLLAVSASVVTAQNINTYAGGGPKNMPATAANLSSPSGFAFDSAGNLYVAAQLVFKVDAGTGLLTVFAGGGGPTPGDGGPATSAIVAVPRAIAFDAGGNLYIAEIFNPRVRRVDASTGVITTVAGNGVQGFFGDGGPATNAQLNNPSGLAVDAVGNIYIADQSNQRVRKVNAATGLISTVAGNGTSGFSGDGGPATSASIGGPAAVSFDAGGNLYIAASGGHRVRKVSAATGVITTVAGNGTTGFGGSFSGDGGPATSAGMNTPSGVAFDAAGNLYIADRSNNRIRKVNATTGIITTIAGNGSFGFAGDGGPATSASLAAPTGVVLDASGNIYFGDLGFHHVRKVDAATGVISTVAGNGTPSFSGDGGPATDGSLFPVGMTFDAVGNLYVADAQNQRIRKVTPAGIIATVAGNGVQGFSGDGGPATGARFSGLESVVLDAAGNLYIADRFNHRVRKVDAATGFISTFAGNGVATFAGDGGPATSASFNNPTGLAFDTVGNLYVADRSNHRVRKVTPGGVISTVAGTFTPGFLGDGGPAASARLNNPTWLAFDPGGNLYITDQGNQRIRKVTTGGVISTFAGNGVATFAGDGGPATSASLNNPIGVACDSGGNLYIAEQNNHRVRKVTPGGVISTVAGTGTFSFGGDGGPATAAALAGPSAVAFGPDGNLYIADRFNARIRSVQIPPSSAPVANNDSYNANEDATLNVSAPGVLSNDTDADGNTLTTLLVAGPSQGSVSLNADGSFTYTPAANYNGPDSFTYLASDGSASSNVATVSITVNPVNDPPTASAGGPYTVNEGGSVSVSAAGADVDGDVVTFAWDLDDNGTYETPGQTASFSAASLDGPSTRAIGVRATDGGGLSATAGATVTVNNVAPTVDAGPDGAATQGSPFGGSGSFTDPGADTWTATVNYGDGTGTQTLALNANKTFTLAHTYVSSGIYTVTVTVSDGTAAAADTVQVTAFSNTCTMLPSDAVAWYPGNNNADDIAGGNNGALQNGATYAAGKVGQAFSLDGVDSFVGAANSPNLNPASHITIAAWVKPTSPSGRIVDKVTAGSADGYFLDIGPNSQGLPVPRLGAGGPNLNCNSEAIPLNAFSYVVGTYDGQQTRLYANGGLICSQPNNAAIPTNSHPLRIGLDQSGGSAFSGIIDEVQIYNRALSAGEVQALYLASGLGVCHPPTTTTAVQNTAAIYSPSDQSVTLSATVTPSAGTVNDGTVTFTVKTSGGATVGSPVTAAVAGNAASAVYTLPGGTAVQTLNVTASYVSSVPDFQPSTGAGTLAVGKATPMITWASPADITYGTALSGVQLNATANVPGSFAYSPAAGTVLHAGTGQTLHADFTPTDTANYDAASKDVTINVARATLTVQADDKTRAYSEPNPAFTYSMMGFVGGDTQASSTTGQPALGTTADSTSAPGTHAITAALGTLASSDYQFAFVNGTLTVTKANQTITFGALADKTYGDADFALSAIASSGLAVGFAASGDCTVTGGGVHLIGAGTCTVTASQGGDSNYNPAGDVAQPFNINKAASAVTVNCPASQTYTGQNVEPCTASYSGAGGLAGTLTPTYANNLNVGTATASASYAGDANHVGGSNSEQFTITSAPTTTTVTCTAAETYTGSPVTPCTVTVTGAGLSLTPAPAYANNVNAGTATASYTYNGDANHTGSSDTETFQITPAASTTVVTFEAGPYIYRGSAFTATASVTGAGGLGVPVAVVYTGDCINVTSTGGCTATATYEGDPNHAGGTDSKSITIMKADATIALGNLMQTYSGAARAASTTTGPSGLSGVTVTYNGSAIPPTGAGSYAVVASLSNQNYQAEDATGTLVVGKAAPVVVAMGNTCTYSGATCAGGGTATGVDGTDLGAVTLAYGPGGGAPVNAGSYTVVASIAETANHTAGSSAPAAVQIDKAIPIISVTVPGGPVTYDGDSHPAGGFAYGVGGPGDVLTPAVAFTYNGGTGAPVNAATYAVVASFAGNNNYLPAVNDSTAITITPAAATINVNGYNGVYDGNAHRATGSATGVLGESLSGLDLGVSFTNVPGGTAQWTFTGDTNYAPDSGTAAVVITKAEQSIHWGDPAPMVYGTPLSGAQLNATVTVVGPSPAGALTYTPGAGAVLGAGAHQALTVNAAGTDNYHAATKTVYIDVAKAAPVVNWVNPAAIHYGTPLSAAQLNALATHPADGGPLSGVALAGTYAYTPAAGSVLPVGDNALSVVFTPDDTANYTSATKAAVQRVNYNVCVLYDQTKAARSGSTIPIKLQLCNASGANLSSPGVVVMAVGTRLVSPDAWGDVEDAGNASPDMNFRFTTFDPATPGYIFNLKTSGLGTGVYQLGFVVGGDPTIYTVQFQVK